MLFQDTINNAYFDWMYDIVCEKRFGIGGISYRKLLMHLHNIPFKYSIPKDSGRAEEGIELRYRFSSEKYPDIEDIGRYIDDPCSVFEMILALAIHCEESIMDNPAYGDRTGQWFWGMITNLGLSHMEDNMYDKKTVDEVINRFLKRKYEPDGRGGLFTIRNCKDDLRKIEIWWQMCWYINDIS
jgi:hypothetical protein